MNRVAIGAALLAGLLTGWVLVDVLEAVTSSGPTTQVVAPTADVPAAPSEPPVPAPPEPDRWLPERQPPATPEQEGLFALLDASGAALARCALDTFPDGAELPTDHVVVDGQVYFPVEPTAVTVSEAGYPNFEPTSMFQFDGEHSYSVTVQVALPGSAPGPCTVKPMQVEGKGLGDVKVVARPVEDVAADPSDDAADAIHPQQVALDTPGLSEGARQWLQVSLDAALALERANAPVPVKGLLDYE